MLSRTILLMFGLVLVANHALALEATGTLKKVDAANGVVVIFANGQDRVLTADRNIKVQDKQGNDLASGLKSKELQAGAEATVIVEREGNQLILKALRLGRKDAAPNLRKPPTGLKPLTEMTADDEYKGEDGGLYGNGKNEPPRAHLDAARQETAKIAPLDREGNPSEDGHIVLLSISMSNATQEFSYFKRIADADDQKSARLTIVDCAQGGQVMAAWAPPDAAPWAVAEQRLASAGVGPNQVQIAWVKLANGNPRGELAEHGKKLQRDTQAVLQNAKARFPNLRIAYLSSRIYGGYAIGPLNPEPYAYEGAFAVRWLIQDQINGRPELNFDADRGEVQAPLLLWGPYLWADGVTPRKNDGLIWERSDMAEDGVHPTNSGRKKVADLLLNLFTKDPLAKTWFIQPSEDR